MKILVAGLPKTGTKSLAKALRCLGYDVYDFLEHFEHHQKEWTKIILHGATSDVFKEMYENVDTILDIPVCFFWKEIHEAFPDAKIIFMQRNSEEEWFESMLAQNAELNYWPRRIYLLFSPTARQLRRYFILLDQAVFGCKQSPGFFETPPVNKLRYLMTYRQHNLYVKQNAPKDKLLVYSVKEGWGPLCVFLGKETPQQAFPHINARGTSIDELLKGDPTARRVLNETVVALAMYTLLFSYFCYKLWSSPDTFIDLINLCFHFVQNVLLAVFTFLFY